MGKEEIARNAMFHRRHRMIGVVNEMNGDVYVDVPSDVSWRHLVQKVNMSEDLLVSDCVKRCGAGG